MMDKYIKKTGISRLFSKLEGKENHMLWTIRSKPKRIRPFLKELEDFLIEWEKRVKESYNNG